MAINGTQWHSPAGIRASSGAIRSNQEQPGALACRYTSASSCHQRSAASKVSGMIQSTESRRRAAYAMRRPRRTMGHTCHREASRRQSGGQSDGIRAALGRHLGGTQKHSEATRSNQKQPEGTRSNQKQPEATRSTQKLGRHSGGIGVAIRNNQWPRRTTGHEQSEASRNNRWQSLAIGGHGARRAMSWGRERRDEPDRLERGAGPSNGREG